MRAAANWFPKATAQPVGVTSPRRGRRAVEFVLVWLLAGIAGIAVAIAQQYNIGAGWDACFTRQPDLEAGGRFAETFEGLVRLIVYPFVLSMIALVGFALGRPRWLAYVLTVALFLTATAGLFWFDYSHHNGLALSDWRTGCPTGRPPGWPSWAGITPTN